MIRKNSSIETTGNQFALSSARLFRSPEILRVCLVFAATLTVLTPLSSHSVVVVCGAGYGAPCIQHRDPPRCTDSGDGTCPNCPPGGGAGGGAGGGGGGAGGGGCSGCKLVWGMPQYWVSEPLLQLRLEDEPLGNYAPGLGPRPDYRLSYRNRGAPPEENSYFSFGTNWSCS